MKKAGIILCALILVQPLYSKAKARPRHAAAPRAAAAAADLGLIDFSVQPFSDQGSHFGLRRLPGEGFCSWELDSAMAFGSLAAAPNPAKRLFHFRIELELEQGNDALFAKPLTDTVEDYPRWALEKAGEAGATAESGLAMPETDALVLAANFTNRSRTALRMRPRLVISGGTDNFDSSAIFDPKTGALVLNLDRSKLVQRKLKESACIVAGSGKSRAFFSGGGIKGSEELAGQEQVAQGVFSLSLGPQAFTVLKPGQALRFPVAITLGLSGEQARLPMPRIWSQWALPKGQAMAKAKARWNLSSLHLPKAADPVFERLSRRAAATLLMNQYSKRQELKSDMLSQAKTSADAFFSDGLPLACLGLAELDQGAAESALLELTSFAAAAPAPVPPYTGEELLLWEASGLPLHAWAAWELFQRDPELNRASAFFAGIATHLRNECSWWPAHRDGDGNGLYAYANDEEKPAYARQTAPASAAGQPVLQTYSVALSSFVAWQMRAASDLAAAANEKQESAKLLAEYSKIAAALKKEARNEAGVYQQGLDGYLPYLLGLDTDLAPARSALKLLCAQAGEALPFAENGVLYPGRAYLMLRTLSLYGYQAEARAAAQRLLTFLGDKPVYSAYDAAGKGQGWAGDASTAAAILEMSLERYSQDAYLLPDTAQLSGGILTLRSPDGSFYLQRVGLPLAKAVYSPISVSATAEGINLSVEKDTKIRVISSGSLDVAELKSKREIFKGTRHAEMILKPKIVYAFKIQKP